MDMLILFPSTDHGNSRFALYVPDYPRLQEVLLGSSLHANSLLVGRVFH